MAKDDNTAKPDLGEDSLNEIATRHALDAVWFTSGHHDPHGYVAMAHKDRGALLARIEAMQAGEKALQESLTIWGKPRA